MDVAKINELQFLHKVQLTNTARSIIEICDKNDVPESDIFTLSTFIYFLSKRTFGEKSNIIMEFTNMTKQQRRSLVMEKDIEGKIRKTIAESFYKKVNVKRVVSSIRIPFTKESAEATKANYNSLIHFYIFNFYEDFEDERFIKKFIELVKCADYENAVRLYFLAILLGRNSLIDKFSRIQRDKCRKNFVYALNREVTMIGTLLVKYGKGKEVEILAEQTLELSNEAVDEANKHVAELQGKFREYDEEVSTLQKALAEAHHKITEYHLKLSEINNQLILEDMKVLVVGDESHFEGYREIVERHGGDFNFTSGVKTKGATAKRKAVSADIVFLVTKWCHHEVTEAIEDFSNIVWVNSAGNDTFERAVLKLRKGG